MGKLAGILYEGPSPITGTPIVAIALASNQNRKTGDMVQVYILRADMDPHVARLANNDAPVCGNCPLSGHNGGCYTITWQAPRSLYQVYKRGGYPHISPDALAGRAIRWGAYGDPALIPLDIVMRANRVARMYTGYTHQWAKPWGAQFKGIFMASVETPEVETRLHAQGWGTFRAGLRDGSDRGESTLCTNELDGTLCADCGACNGRPKRIFIRAHGQYAGRVPAEKRRLQMVQS